MIGFEHGTLALQTYLVTTEWTYNIAKQQVCVHVLETAKLPHFLSTLLQIMALEFNLLALSFSDSYCL